LPPRSGSYTPATRSARYGCGTGPSGQLQLVAHAEHDLAPLAPRQAPLEGGPRLLQHVDRVDLRTQLTVVDETCDRLELLPVRLDEEVDAGRRGLGRQGYEPTAGTHDRRRACEELAADRVEDEVDRFDAVLDAFAASVDDLVRTERLCGVGVGSAGDHVRAAVARELGGEVPDAAGRAEDQDALARFEASVVEQALPCAEGCERDRGARDVVERARLGCEQRGRDDGEVCGRAVAAEVGERVDLVADRDAVRVRAERGDLARELVRRDRRQAVDGPLELVLGDCRGADAHERVPGAGLRRVDLLDLKPRLRQSDCTHHPLRSSSAVVVPDTPGVSDTTFCRGYRVTRGPTRGCRPRGLETLVHASASSAVMRRLTGPFNDYRPNCRMAVLAANGPPTPGKVDIEIAIAISSPCGSMNGSWRPPSSAEGRPLVRPRLPPQHVRGERPGRARP